MQTLQGELDAAIAEERARNQELVYELESMKESRGRANQLEAQVQGLLEDIDRNAATNATLMREVDMLKQMNADLQAESEAARNELYVCQGALGHADGESWRHELCRDRCGCRGCATTRRREE